MFFAISRCKKFANASFLNIRRVFLVLAFGDWYRRHDSFQKTLIHQTFRWYLKWRNPHPYKQYGYGLCKGKPTSKIAENKAQETLHFRYLKCLVT